MLDSFALLTAMRGIRDEYVLDTMTVLGYAEESPKPHCYNRKLWSTLLIAAILVSLFTTVAYATNHFGLRALLRPDSVELNGVEYSELSLTQPQAVPEDLDPAIAEKVNNSRVAWAEWEKYLRDTRVNGELPVPVAYSYVPAEADAFNVEENKDGTGTIHCFSKKEDGSFEPMADIPLTAEEVAELSRFDAGAQGKELPGYVGYGVYTEEDAARLEEIAAKYGLALKREQHLAWSSDTTGQTGTNFYTNEQLAAMTAQIGCAGNLFRSLPCGFDKVYWFGDGTFAIRYFVDLALEKQADCYAYNSVYSTLSSGKEVVNWESDLSSFTERSHITPDGTEVTILSDGEDAYICVYLENSFFAEHITCSMGLTDTELDTIADGLQYSLIGK